MRILKSIGLLVICLAEQAWSVPQWIAREIQRKRRQSALDALEMERLDRIRHPSKYLGK